MVMNEMNYAAERPGVVIDWTRHNTTRSGPAEVADPMRRGVSVRFNALPDHSNVIRTTRGAIVSPGEVITPELYARCYRLCRDAIHRIPGHEDDQVLVGAVAPWNTQTIYPGNANGDWIQYFRDLLQMVGPDHCDGFALRAFTHADEAARIESDERLVAPFQHYHKEFHAYRDFMHAVPESMRHLAAYITEAGPTEPWIDSDTGWVRHAYADVHRWNQEPGSQQIRAMVLYRWPRVDRWYIEGKSGVIEDFKQALAHDYRWQGAESEDRPEPAAPAPAGQPYRVAWLDDRFPERLQAGTIITVPLTLRNEGSLAWNWGGGNPFRLGYHYYRGRRRLPMPDHLDLRTDIPNDVPPGATVAVDARIALPAAPGNYTLELDLVQEGVTWFKEQDSPVLTRWLTVEDERPSAASQPQNGNGAAETASLVPLFQDVSGQLPQSGVAYARRSLDQVRYLVISHTGTDPRLRLDKIARAHIRRGYPGIAYDFVVDAGGRIFRVSALEQVAEPGQSWSLQGVNIGLLGNFQDAPPPLSQLEATGRLCAWLAQNLNLQPDAIVGLGQLTRTESPGRTFYRGPEWQAILRRQVQLHLGVLSRGAEEARLAQEDVAREALTKEMAALQAALEESRAEARRLRSRQEQLELEADDLRRQYALQPDSIEGRPILRDVTAQLPRDPARYRTRSPEDVRTIVINHSGGPGDLPLDQIAEAHMPDWPGILYDFCIDPDGILYQTQPLDEVADTEQPTIAQAINIAFLGRFDDESPTSAQLYAGGQLIAWLLRRFPHLAVDDIKGLSELMEHHSPGRQWGEGQRWRNDLLAAVRRAAGLVDPTETEAELQREVEELTRRLQVFQHNNQKLQEQRQRLQTDNQDLQARLAQGEAVERRFIVPRPALRDVTEKLPRHPTLRYARRARHQITHVAVHHTATLPTVGPMRIAELHVNPDPARGKEPWPGIGYHYFIHADGSIDQTNELDSVAYHVYRHNAYTVGVAFAGSFMNGATPTSAQLRSGAHLMAWLMQEFNIPLARVWGHREFPDNVTVCPGSEWTGGQRWRDQLFAQIEQIQQGIGVKSIRHYMLFWQRPYPGPLARRDFINAVGYFARFRPTVGFSPEDARQAEYVTIVGGHSGVSAETEQMLRDSGCKVERIAGRDEDETSRLLAELVRLNRRFQSFEADF
jgi:N-acetyl-anhydromuramyl-L-alanine amidase AmpD